MNPNLFDDILQKFINASPVTVMVRGLLEHLLSADKLDQFFENHSKKQYTRDLLFSTVVQLVLTVVLQIKLSVRSAYQKSNDITVSCASLYNKLNGLETTTSAELVRDISTQARALIKEMNAENPAWLHGYRTKLLDGNCIEATEHRLVALRNTKSGALPGKSLVVFDPQTELAIDVFPCEDGHAQERSLLEAVLKTIAENDLWVADRNFCTQLFLFGIEQKKAVFIIREHAQMPVEVVSEARFICNTETGQIYEQDVTLKSPEGIVYSARRIIVKLNTETRDGDIEIYLLTNLKKEVATAEKIAEIYQGRWGIETAFQRLEKHFNSEINTLGYPNAALFCFCLALVAFNLYAVVMAALRAANPTVNIKKEVSEYYIADDINSIYEGMDIAVDDNAWNIFRSLNCAQMAVLLIYLAQQVDLKKFKKHQRGAKKIKAEIKYDKKNPHVSTFKLLSNATDSP
jgi:IS4 transposase